MFLLIILHIFGAFVDKFLNALHPKEKGEHMANKWDHFACFMG